MLPCSAIAQNNLLDNVISNNTSASWDVISTGPGFSHTVSIDPKDGGWKVFHFGFAKTEPLQKIVIQRQPGTLCLDCPQ